MRYIFFALLIVLIFPTSVSAHSGRTDAYGGHNCYVGACAGTYHYHNGGYAPPPVIRYSTSTPIPTPVPTKSPTSTPIPTSTPLPTKTPTMTPKPTTTSTIKIESTAKQEIKGESISPTNSPIQAKQETKETNSTVVIIGIGVLGAAGFWLIRKLQKKNK